ncbi:MAG: Lrp/AsnC family transcriptional regulator [Xanthomonadales bacterium]|nr:Lrp/AsnC family transcriptional regulator [Xanthomonadales bacterium]
MVTAIVLVNARRDMVNETAQDLTELQGVSEVYSVAGPYDLVAIIRARDNEEMADLVTGSMLRMVGIEKTTTLVAFRAYSRYDLERMFAIGLEEGDE